MRFDIRLEMLLLLISSSFSFPIPSLVLSHIEMANKIIAMERTLGLFKQSFNGLIRRSYNASAATPPPPSAAAASASSATTTAAAATVSSKKPKHKKKKNFFEVAQFLPNWGVGYQMAKTHWVGISYQITKINLYKDGRHGKAWGIVHKEGLPAADAPKKISGVHKRCWKYIPHAKTKIEDTVKAEVQAA